MKNPTHPFATQYPYLNYWREDWGDMETTNGDWNRQRIRLIDEGRRFDKETIAALEEDYKNRD